MPGKVTASRGYLCIIPTMTGVDCLRLSSTAFRHLSLVLRVSWFTHSYRLVERMCFLAKELFPEAGNPHRRINSQVPGLGSSGVDDGEKRGTILKRITNTQR